MSDEESFPDRDLLEDLFVEGKWGFRVGDLKRLSAWVISAKGNIDLLLRENKTLLATQEKITAGNARKKKALREERDLLRADNQRLAVILQQYLEKQDACIPRHALLHADLVNNRLLHDVSEKKQELKKLRTRVKMWRGAANALYSAFWRGTDKQDADVPDGASTACRWLIEEARKEGGI